MTGRRSSGEIVPLAKYQVDRPTVDYQDDSSGPVTRATPTKIGRYTVLDLLGVGGMGVVCTAYDPKLDRKVALKLLRKKGGSDGRNSTGQARLVREAQALAKLSHPNIVTVHDVDKVDGQIYMAMEYVDGVSLDKWMLQAEREWKEVVQVFVHAARGLAAAHAAGITHRDFKPANVLIGKDGRVLVVDFGLAKSHEDKHNSDPESEPGPAEPRRADPAEVLRERGSLMDVIGTTQDTKLTQVGRTVGTPAYMAPEQFLGLTVGPETDQFSFGVALFESLYGYLPFPDDDREELIERVTEGQVAETPKDTPVPSWVHRVVLRALQQHPEDRYPSMDALIAALQADPAKRRRRAMLALGGVLLVGMSTWGVAQALANEDDTCTGAAERMDEIWNDGRRAEIEAAFAATELYYARDQWERVDKELSRRTDAWVDHHVEVCRATNVRKDQSTHLMDVRMACLERRRGELRALVEVFVSPDEDVVLEAVKAAQSLEDSERCTTELEDAGFAADPAQKEKIQEIDRLLARSKAMEWSGKPERAVDVAARAVWAARELGHQPTLARAAIQHARLRAERTDDLEAARNELVEAVTLAAETDQPALEVLGWSRLVVVEGVQRGHPEAGLAFRVPAEIALDQLQDLQLEATLLQAVGSVLQESGDHRRALETQLAALEKYRNVFGQQHTTVAAVLSNVGAAYGKLGQIEEARRYLEDAAAMLQNLHGPHHPILGSARVNLGAMLQQAGDPEGAHAQYLLAEQVFRISLPSGHPRMLKALLGLAQTEQLLDPARAERRFESVLAMLRDQKEPDLRVMAASYNSLGNVQRKEANAAQSRGDLAIAAEKRRKAMSNFSAALETFTRSGSESVSPASRMPVYANMCYLELDRGDARAAIEHCQTAWKLELDAGMVDRHGVNSLVRMATAKVELGERSEAIKVLREGLEFIPPDLSIPVRMELANLLWETPTTRKSAKDIVSTTVDTLRASLTPEELRVVEVWLVEHPL